MKRLSICLLMIVFSLTCLAGCGGGGAEGDFINLASGDTLSPLAAYTMAYNIAQNPTDYNGKSVEAEGNLIYNDLSSTGYYIEIADATGCCFQNLEVNIPKELGIPEDSSLIHVTGVFTVFTTESGAESIRIDVETIEDLDYLFE